MKACSFFGHRDTPQTEELKAKEAYLREYVRKLEEQGIEVPGWETETSFEEESGTERE